MGDDKISILLYADDLVLIGKNENDLQAMLLAMNDWSKQWRLRVNINKSKVLHFRPVNHNATQYNFSYGENMLERVPDYKYLGVYLDEFMKYVKCSSLLADSAGRALGGIISKIKTLKDCGYKTYTRLFESGVLPILNYGSEIWGFGNFPKCDSIMNRAMRYFMGVHRFAPTDGVQGDMGWMSLRYRRYIAMLKFWNRLVKMNESRLTKRVFLWYYDWFYNWFYDIKRIAMELDMVNIYNTKDVFIDSQVYDKCQYLMFEQWKKNISEKPKLRLYREIKTHFEPELYLVRYLPKHIRSIFAQLRVGILPIRIETGRYTNIFDENTGNFRRMNADERICNICNMNSVEDEIHFLFYCNSFHHERADFVNDCVTEQITFCTLSDIDKLKYLMENNWRELANFAYKIWVIRQNMELT